MTCRDAHTLMLEVLTGRTPPDMRRTLDGHLASCSSCRRRAAELEETIRALRAVPDPSAPAGFWPGFMASLEARVAKEDLGLSPLARLRMRLRLTPPTWAAAALSAAAIAAVLLSSPLGRVGPGPSLPQQPAGEPQVQEPLGVVVTEAMKAVLPSIVSTAAIWEEGLGASETEFMIEIPGGSP